MTLPTFLKCHVFLFCGKNNHFQILAVLHCHIDTCGWVPKVRPCMPAARTRWSRVLRNSFHQPLVNMKSLPCHYYLFRLLVTLWIHTYFFRKSYWLDLFLNSCQSLHPVLLGKSMMHHIVFCFFHIYIFFYNNAHYSFPLAYDGLRTILLEKANRSKINFGLKTHANTDNYESHCLLSWRNFSLYPWRQP